MSKPSPFSRVVNQCHAAKQVRWHLAKGLLLVDKDLHGESGVQIRVVDAASFELSVLVVLDQVVIRVAREGQGIEHQRIHSRKLQ